ncbi:hypothetical protein Fmac_004151 [Flemingia macrophylla]|uniref:MACPF domain-containing protein n=1 Tax=Flemingia macrophylla TaxID=520843 RepID=A0ABD1N433_9FABA
MAASDSRLEAAQKAINSIGLGFDITQDIGFDNCKKGPRLIFFDEGQGRILEIPGGVSIPNVPNTIKCVRGESIRVHSGGSTWMRHMLKHFNQQMRVEGRTTTGHFCASFGLSGGSVKHLSSIRSLAYDGWFIKSCGIELEKYRVEIPDHLIEAMPCLWDPPALARMCYTLDKQDTSYLDPTNVHKLLEDTASVKFGDSSGNNSLASEDLCKEKNLFVIHSRKGGSSQKVYHNEWLETIDSEPDVISMFFLPLTSLLNGIPGSGFVNYALNLYLRWKPSIENVVQFLEFQLPKQWAPIASEIALGSRWKHQTWIRCSVLGPKLYINTIPAFSKVTGTVLKKAPEWDLHLGLDELSNTSGGIFGFISKESKERQWQGDQPKPGDVTIGSGSNYFGRPTPVHTPKLQRLVDTSEIKRGPEDTPGYWVVSGARLFLQQGKLYLHVKYSFFFFAMRTLTQVS